MSINFSPRKDKWYQDSDDKVDYKFDWSKVLEDGETISSSTWDTENSDDDDALNLTSATNEDESTVIWVDGGTVGIEYKVTNQITTSESRKYTASIYIEIVNK